MENALVIAGCIITLEAFTLQLASVGVACSLTSMLFDIVLINMVLHVTASQACSDVVQCCPMRYDVVISHAHKFYGM